MIALRCFFDIKTHRFYAVIAWFNGGLFKTIDIPPLTIQDLAALRTAAETLDWRSIEPVIFGTLFERGLNPLARAPLGAHYTDTANQFVITRHTDTEHEHIHILANRITHAGAVVSLAPLLEQERAATAAAQAKVEQAIAQAAKLEGMPEAFKVGR